MVICFVCWSECPKFKVFSCSTNFGFFEAFPFFIGSPRVYVTQDDPRVTQDIPKETQDDPRETQDDPQVTKDDPQGD